MTLSPGRRKILLTVHVATSVGWLGSVAAFLALAIAGVTSREAGTVRAMYLAADVVAREVIIPFACASLVVGTLQALGSSWGLLRHYWVVTKLVLTAVGTLLLAVHTRPIGLLAGMARAGTLPLPELARMQVQAIFDASLALVLLLTTTTLSVVKPRGLTRYGRRVRARLPETPPGATPG